MDGTARIKDNVIDVGPTLVSRACLINLLRVIDLGLARRSRDRSIIRFYFGTRHTN